MNQRLKHLANKLKELKIDKTTNQKLVVESVFDFNFFDILESEEDEDMPIGGWGERSKVAEKPKPQAEPKKEVSKVSQSDKELPYLTYMSKKYPKTKTRGRTAYSQIDKKASKDVRVQQRKHATDDELLKRAYYKQHKGDPNRVGFPRRIPHTTAFVGVTVPKGTHLTVLPFEVTTKKK